MTYLTCQVEIDNTRDLSCDLENPKGFLLKLGEDGRLGKGGHMENLEPTPKFKLDLVYGWTWNLRIPIIFIKFRDHP